MDTEGIVQNLVIPMKKRGMVGKKDYDDAEMPKSAVQTEHEEKGGKPLNDVMALRSQRCVVSTQSAA